MENQNKNLVKHIFVTGSIVAGSLLGLGTVKTINAGTLFNYGSLGSGAELRSSLLDSSPDRNLEMKCGSKTEKKSGPNTKEGKSGDKKMDSKAKDGKCGEGKCGDKKTESKTKDAKCGEGKCGDKKMDKKEMNDSKSAEKAAPSKK